MADFITTFLAVFSAMMLTKIAEEIYHRYAQKTVKKGFDKVDHVVSKIKTIKEGTNAEPSIKSM